jgi:hypothetical protein
MSSPWREEIARFGVARFANPWHDEIGRFAPKGSGSKSDGVPVVTEIPEESALLGRGEEEKPWWKQRARDRDIEQEIRRRPPHDLFLDREIEEKLTDDEEMPWYVRERRKREIAKRLGK